MSIKQPSKMLHFVSMERKKEPKGKRTTLVYLKDLERGTRKERRRKGKRKREREIGGGRERGRKRRRRLGSHLEAHTGARFCRLSLSLLVEVTNSICTRQSTPGW